MSPVCSARGRNSPGRDDASHRVVPTQQRLERTDRAGAQLELRLEVQHELVVLDRAPQVAEHRESAATAAVVLDGEDFDARVRALRHVHRDVGPLQQRCRFGAVVGGHRDPDARLELDRQGIERERLAKHVEQRVRHGQRRCRSGHRRQQHRELVATESRDRRAVGGTGEALCNLLQHEVAAAVAEHVVDVLEPVEVDQQDGDASAAVGRVSQCARRLRVEAGPVRKLRERIVRRLMLVALQLRLQSTRCVQNDAEQRGPQECEAGNEQDPHLHDVFVDRGRDRRVGKVDLERAGNGLVRGELDRRVHLEQLAVAAVIQRVLLVGEIAHLGVGLAVERLVDFAVGREPPADEVRVVGVDDPEVAVPDLDARDAVTEEPGAEGLIELDHLGGRQPVGELAASETRLHGKARHEHRGLPCARNVAMLDAAGDAARENHAEHADEERAQDREPRNDSESTHAAPGDLYRTC